jgi:hypothetical protein
MMQMKKKHWLAWFRGRELAPSTNDSHAPTLGSVGPPGTGVHQQSVVPVAMQVER